LVETACTLLPGTNIPVHHCGDVFLLTTRFQINRMTSSFLNNHIPYAILFLDEPLFHVSLMPVCVLFMTCFLGWTKYL